MWVPFSIMLLLVAASLYIFRRRLLRLIGRFLVAHDAIREPHDVIVLMNGSISTRPYLAAEVYRERKAPVLIARLADTREVQMGVIPNVSDAAKTLLERLGVPAHDIHLLRDDGWVAGTWNEALLHRARIRERGFSRVLIVTDSFHTRRARWTFHRLLRDDHVSVRCVATRYSLGLVDTWWRSEFGLIQVVVEYLKFFHYWRSRNVFPMARSDLPPADGVRRMLQ